jgi:spermidine/putrescine ABC transporter ATP-binding subunit
VASVALTGVAKFYASVAAVDDVSLDIESGKFLTLLGPSGCGKSTTLRLIAGLIAPDRGEILIEGRVVTNVPTYRRRIGMVFQNLALFPHMTVAQNVAFGLRMQGIGRAEREGTVRDALALVKLNGLEDRLPRQLSGGQQQRVALARALVTQPAVLLLDEPFAALDRKLRLSMQDELRDLTRRTCTTAVFVTHDQDEALVLSDRIAVMNRGRIEQIDRPQVVFERPNSAFVADFMGVTNLLTGRVATGSGERMEIAVDGSMLRLHANSPLGVGQAVHVAIRPEAIALATEPPCSPTAGLSGMIEHVVYQGTGATYRLRSDGGGPVLVVRVPLLGRDATRAFNVGDRAWASWDPATIHVIGA